jgi:erythromycin esterase
MFRTSGTTSATSVRRRGLLGLAATLALGTLATGITPAAADAGARSPAAVLDPYARSLGSMDALGRMVGNASVVGLGEASHSAHEFFTLKQRLFRHLVATKGFTTFALEASWSTGLLLDDYVVNGIGDPAQIMREEFQGQYVFWNTEEYLDLIHWMRGYNTSHPGKPRLRFVGNDLGYAGPNAFEQVAAYLAGHRPELSDRLDGYYRSIKPLRDADGNPPQAGAWMGAQLTKELAGRQADAARADSTLKLLREQGAPKRGSSRAERRAYERAVQHATAITQTFTAYAIEDFPERMRYRDSVMAENTAWWREHKGAKILLGSNNGHVAYTSDNPMEFPEPVGKFLKQKLGTAYVSIGLTFSRGTVHALPDFTAQQPKTYPVEPAPKGYNEHTLDQVERRDFAMDLRTVSPEARSWLDQARPTRSYGLYWSEQHPSTALGSSYDILVHLNTVEAGHLR